MQKAPITKYRPFNQIPIGTRQWPDRVIDRAPDWCSVDLRDGNQSLAIPMSVREKLEFFEMLTNIGFKEIEVGFPSASDTEFHLARELIDHRLIPDDVTIQVLVQCREHLIRRTFDAIRGARRAIVHFYNSTNPLQRRVTFGMSKEQIRQIAVEGARLVKSLEKEAGDTEIAYEYSPESFMDTEIDYAIEVCEAVMEQIQPTPQRRIILNLPSTVEMSTPNVYADQIEYFCRNLKNRDCAIISLHTHNDRGTGVASSELGLMAGAQRVEGTLFGNGERTGNVDIVTLAMNMYTQGVDPKLDFSDVNAVREIYERCTRMDVHQRHPYAGDLVFTAFSGSHQDAIKKGMDQMDRAKASVADGTEPLWQVPYLPIDPGDIGRSYEAIIRINSQSGKGGVAYVMEHEYGFEMPKAMHSEFGQVVTGHADNSGSELPPSQIKTIFYKEYIDRDAPFKLLSCDVVPSGSAPNNIEVHAKVSHNGEPRMITGRGNGPINALVKAIESVGWKQFRVLDYTQHALSSGSAAEAASYIRVERAGDKRSFWGVAVDSNIEMSGLKALISAVNRATAVRT
ncbi:MAG: 2-isopropylmalate synthase [Opitutales bacterium]|jgi:2-isopropylmalate synthase